MLPPSPADGMGLAEPALLTIATVNLMVMITLFMQGLLIAVSTRVIKSYRGVWEAAIATLTLASGFLIITLARPPLESRLEPFGTQFLFICGYALIYLAICRFTERPFRATCACKTS